MSTSPPFCLECERLVRHKESEANVGDPCPDCGEDLVAPHPDPCVKCGGPVTPDGEICIDCEEWFGDSEDTGLNPLQRTRNLVIGIALAGWAGWGLYEGGSTLSVLKGLFFLLLGILAIISSVAPLRRARSSHAHAPSR